MAILAEYPPHTPLSQIAREKGLNHATLTNYVCEKRLRPRSSNCSNLHPVIRKLVEGRSMAECISDSKVSRFTINNWRRSRRNPSFINVVRVAAAQGYTIGLMSKDLLNDLLDKVNALRSEDISGPEACGAITDIILDAMEAQP